MAQRRNTKPHQVDASLYHTGNNRAGLLWMVPKTCFPAEKTILIDQTGSTLYSAIASGRQAGRQAGKRLQTSPLL
ncbi:hypothetical protein [Acetobacter senegalensis]|nr:hypothetical protein [Acetobacter senegalensis]